MFSSYLLKLSVEHDSLSKEPGEVVMGGGNIRLAGAASYWFRVLWQTDKLHPYIKLVASIDNLIFILPVILVLLLSALCLEKIEAGVLERPVRR